MTFPLRLNVTAALSGKMRRMLSDSRARDENVGLLYVRSASLYASNVVVAIHFELAPDDAYASGKAGANFDVRWIMERANHASLSNCGLLWVHLHEHDGLPSFSQTDLITSNAVCPALYFADPTVPQGVLVLSNNNAAGKVMVEGALIDFEIVREVGRFSVPTDPACR